MYEYDIDIIKATVEGDELINIVSNNFQPEDVFSVEELEGWAKDNGFVKEED
jgi:hypothetical protein